MTIQGPDPKSAQDRLARSIILRISDSTDELPHEITERLRAARVQAISRRRTESPRTASIAPALAGSSNVQLGGGAEGGWWSRVTSALALVALVAGMVAITDLQDDLRANELAEIDAELLTDDLPPAAYIDPGFAQYLRSNSNH